MGSGVISMTDKPTVQEAAQKLKEAENSVLQARTELAQILKEEIELGTKPTDLARQTDIKRPRIYWLIQNLKEDRND